MLLTLLVLVFLTSLVMMLAAVIGHVFQGRLFLVVRLALARELLTRSRFASDVGRQLGHVLAELGVWR